MQCGGSWKHKRGELLSVACENQAIVQLTVEQNGEEKTFPACIMCWNEANRQEITTHAIVPIVEQEEGQYERST